MDPTETEIKHAIGLLRALPPGWKGPMAIIPVDPECRWDDGSGPCGEPLDSVSILLYEESAEAVAFCKHHIDCLKSGLDRWRAMS